MKIYGHFLSAPANMVRLTASALNIEHDYHQVDLMSGEQNTPQFQAVSPFGKVPAIDDNGFTICESGAICRYLASKEDSVLYPADLKARAKVDQWVDFAAQHTRAAMSKVLFNKFFAPMMGRAIDEKSMAEGAEMLEKQFPAIEHALKASPYLTGSAMTLADIAMVSAMEPFEMIGVSLDEFPAINKWRGAMMAQDWYQNVHSHYGAEMPK